MTKPRWALKLDIVGQHRYFADAKAQGRIAVADQSGSTPDRTDGGIWYLDTQRPIRENAEWRRIYDIPVVDRVGKRMITTGTEQEATAVCREFGMRIDPTSHEDEDGEDVFILGED